MKKTITLFLFGLLITSFNYAQTTTFIFTGALDTYTVPAGVSSIKIECYGAQGAGDNGTSGGLGAYMSGEFVVNPGDQFKILVGGQGTADVGQMSTGGGGGSYVTDLSNVPFVIAGGGGGSNGTPVNGNENAPITTSGLDGYSPSNPSNYGVGGTSGAGAVNGPSTPCAGNGGGLLTDGAPEFCCFDSQFGIAFVNGGTANTGGGCGTASPGGFGGGGSGGNYGCGGGGGYSGGGANYHTGGNGGGGGSYNAGTNQVNTAGTNSGNGQIIITVLCDGLVTSVSSTSLCSNDSLTLSAASMNGGTVTWNLGVVDNVAFQPDTVGTITYIATSTDPTDCAFNVDVIVLSIPEFTLSTSDEFGGLDGGVYMTLLDGVFPLTYDWDNDGTGDFDDAQNLINIGPGTYTVVVEHGNGCSATDNATVNSQLGVGENSSLISIYPNPVSDILAVEFAGEFLYQITDLSGRIVLQGNGVDKETISVKEFAAGTYVINVSGTKGIHTIEFVKQ